MLKIDYSKFTEVSEAFVQRDVLPTPEELAETNRQMQSKEYPYIPDVFAPTINGIYPAKGYYSAEWLEQMPDGRMGLKRRAHCLPGIRLRNFFDSPGYREQHGE